MKKIIIILFIFLSFFLGAIFEYYKIYPRNKIVNIVKKYIVWKVKKHNVEIDKISQQCFADLQNTDIGKNNNNYKNLLIVGHSYGKPNDTNNGIYPKLISHLNGQKKQWDYLIAAGDFVRLPSRQNFILASKQLGKFSNNVIFVPGNHDIGYNYSKLDIFLERFKTLFNFVKVFDTLIFTIDTNKGWMVDENQKNRIKKIIEENHDANNIIIISHQLIWMDKFKDEVFPNGIYGKVLSNNFDEFENFLKSYEKKLFFISGDVGATYKSSNYFCRTNQQITYIATGMGLGINDNYVVINVFNNVVNINIKTVDVQN